MEDNKMEPNKDMENKIQPKTEGEIKQLAMDIGDGKVFSHTQCTNPGDIRSVFMPLALGVLSGWSEKEFKDIGLIYEYYEKAGPRSVNGMPMFMSMRLLSIDDLRRLRGALGEYLKFKKAFMAGDESAGS
jgi:hypothetical protein